MRFLHAVILVSCCKSLQAKENLVPGQVLYPVAPKTPPSDASAAYTAPANTPNNPPVVTSNRPVSVLDQCQPGVIGMIVGVVCRGGYISFCICCMHMYNIFNHTACQCIVGDCLLSFSTADVSMCSTYSEAHIGPQDQWWTLALGVCRCL